MNKKHLSFEEISEQYDFTRSNNCVSNEHLRECSDCIDELKKLSRCIESLGGYKKITIIDTDSFMRDVLAECKKKRIRILWANSFYRHSIYAAAAVIVVIMLVPFITPNTSEKKQTFLAENSIDLNETEIAVNSENTDEVVYFLKRNNFRIISVEKDRVIAESRYRDFIHLKNTLEGSLDNNFNFLNKRNLSLAGTSAGNNVYIPGGDRAITFSIIIKK